MPKNSWFHAQMGEPERLGSAYFHVRATDHEEAALKTKVYVEHDQHITAGVESVEYDPELTAHYRILGYKATDHLRLHEEVKMIRVVQDLRLPGKVYTDSINDVFDRESYLTSGGDGFECSDDKQQVVAV